eukprot:gene5876-11870_t
MNPFALLTFVGLLGICSAVDRSKFRKCSDTGFCKRYRGKPVDASILYKIETSSIRTQEKDGKLLATLNGGPAGSPPLNIEVAVNIAGSLRVRISENTVRWQPQDILLNEALKPAPLTILPPTDQRIPPSVRTRDANTYVCISVGEAVVLVLQTAPAPLLIELYVDGIPLVTANSRSLMHFETKRIKSSTSTLSLSGGDATDRHKGKDVVDYGEDGLAIYADGTREEKTDGAAVVEVVDEGGEWEESFNGHADKKPSGPMSVGIDFTFPYAAQIYGIPEHASSLALRTTTTSDGSDGGAAYSDPYRMYNLDVFEYELDEPMALYGNIPLMLAHGKYQGKARTTGVFWFNPSETFVDVSKSPTTGSPESHWISESGVVDFFLLPGPTPANVYKQYTTLTGTQQLPPMFSLGYHQCRWNYRDERDVATVEGMFEKLDYPVDVIWLDIEHTDGKRYFTWDKNVFPNPIQMQKNVSAHGRKMVTIVDPHIKRDDNYAIHKEATAKGLYIKTADNKQDFDGWCWPGSSSYLDFTNSKVREWWASRFSLQNYIGSTMDLFTWNDMNEPSVFNGPEVSMPKDTLSLEGVEHREWHNLYGMYMQRATSEGLTMRDPKKALRPFVLSRAFWAGSQRFGAIWTGDNMATWSHLKAAAPMLLSINLAGLSFCGADVGGFFGEPDAELFTRWYQAGAFTPFFRGHAHHDTKRREPWVYGEPYTTINRATAMIRYSLLPYWYTVFYEAYSTGMPVMRALFSEFPEEEAVWTVDDQWMVGDALMVKPVTDAGRVSVDLFLPGSDGWYDFYSLQSVSTPATAAGRTITVPAPLDKIPVYIRGGRIIPRKMRLRRSAPLMFYDPYTLVIAPDCVSGKASGQLYMDDEHTLEHETNKAFSLRTFLFEDNSLKCISTSPVVASSSSSLSAAGSSGSGNEYKSKNTVERVVISGQKSAPSKVILRTKDTTTTSTITSGSSGNEWITTELVFNYDKVNGVVTVKKPDVLVSEDWELTLEA